MHLAEAVTLLRDGEQLAPTIPAKPAAVVALMTQTLDECGFTVTTAVDDWIDALPQEQSALLGRFLTEATTNVLKHGQVGAKVSIECRLTPASYLARVANPSRSRQRSSTSPTGTGLRTLKADALSKDADVTWDAAGKLFTTTLAGSLDDLSDALPQGWLAPISTND